MELPEARTTRLLHLGGPEENKTAKYKTIGKIKGLNMIDRADKDEAEDMKMIEKTTQKDTTTKKNSLSS